MPRFNIDEESAPDYHEGVRLVTLKPPPEETAIADAAHGVRSDWTADFGTISAGKRADTREQVGLIRKLDRYWNVCMANVDQHTNMATSVTLPGEHTDPIVNGSLLVSEVSLFLLFAMWLATMPYCCAYALHTRDQQVAHLIRRTIHLDISDLRRCCSTSMIGEAMEGWTASGATKAEVAMGPAGLVISPSWSTGHRVYVMGVPRRPSHVKYYRSVRDDQSLTEACVLEILSNAGRTKVVTHYTTSGVDTILSWLIVHVCPVLVTIMLAASAIVSFSGTRGGIVVATASAAIAIAVLAAAIPAVVSATTTADVRKVAKGRITYTWKSLDKNLAETHPVHMVRQAAHVVQSLAYGQRHSYQGLGTNLLRSIPGEPTGETYTCNAGLALSAVCSSVPSEPTQYSTVIDLGVKITINTTSNIVASRSAGAMILRAGRDRWIN